MIGISMIRILMIGISMISILMIRIAIILTECLVKNLVVTKVVTF